MSSKGLSPLISTVFVILLGIAMITIIFTSLGKVQFDISSKASEDQLTIVARDLGAEIVNIYQSVKDFNTNPQSNSTVLVREITVRLPDTVGGKNYKIDLEEPANVLLGISEFIIDGEEVNSTTNRPTSLIVAESGSNVVAQRIFNVDIGLQGSTKGGTERLRGYKYDYNGATREKIILGNDEIIIGVNSLQTVQNGQGCAASTNVTVSGHALYTKGGVVSGTARISIVEKEQFVEGSVNPEFSLSFCSVLTNQTEYTALINVIDNQGSSGFLRKKLLA